MQRRASDPARNQYSHGSAWAESNRFRVPDDAGDGGHAFGDRFASAPSLRVLAKNVSLNRL